jgi:hypothetical protein
MEKIQLKSVQLNNLSGLSEVITIKYDNSINIIEEMGGEDYFYIKVNTKQNCALKINNDPKFSLSKQFLLAEKAGIYSSYIELESFEGIFEVSADITDGKWSIEFQCGDVESSENIEESDINLIEKVLTPKVAFLIADEVLSALRY